MSNNKIYPVTRHSAFLLSILFLFALISPVFAQESIILIDKIGTFRDGDPDADKIRLWNNYKYIVLEDGTAAIKGYEGDEKVVVIPDLIDGTIKVTEVRSFRHGETEAVNKQTISITLPVSLRAVEDNPFLFCQNLQQISISENNPVFEVTDGVLFSKEDHSLVSYPVGKPDTSYVIPEGTVSIGKYSFFEARYLNSVILPEGIESVGVSSFAQSQNLTSVNFPEGIKVIEQLAFFNCSSLTDLELPNSISEIGESAFLGCKGITSLRLPKELKIIKQEAFSGCKNLESVSIPESVVAIEGGAFENCEKLSSIFIPENVELIQGGAFLNCRNLTDFSVSEENPVYFIHDGALYDRYARALVMYLISGGNDTFIIPNETLYIASYAFSGAKNLKTLIFPESVEQIGSYAFQQCTNLTNIDLPKNVSVIGRGIFKNCTNLESVNLPKGILEIPYEAFRGCRSLTSIVIPDGVQTIGALAFDHTDNLKSITISASVTNISSLAFSNPVGVTIITERGSSAEHWSAVSGVEIIYIDEEK